MMSDEKNRGSKWFNFQGKEDIWNDEVNRKQFSSLNKNIIVLFYDRK